MVFTQYVNNRTKEPMFQPTLYPYEKEGKGGKEKSSLHRWNSEHKVQNHDYDIHANKTWNKGKH